MVSIEADEDLAEYARRRLQTAGTDVTVETADGAAGWHAGAPFDRVIATCRGRSALDLGGNRHAPAAATGR